ncbi:MAG: hypothetical protein ACREEM_38590, partial [Blastocatellia bacterium]
MKPAITASLVISAMLLLAALSLACGLVAPPVVTQPLLDGVWEGQIEMLVMRKRYILRFGNEQEQLRA